MPLPAPPRTFAELLTRLQRSDPGRPLITFYDHSSGDRVELSVTTYANWVAKAAGLLTEFDLERGQRLRIDLPTHWMTPIFLGAAWLVGLEVLTDESDEAGDVEAVGDAVVCGPDRVEHWGAQLASRPDLVVLASSLHPLGTRFVDPLPPGVIDIGVEIWAQPDGFVAFDPPEADDLAVPGESQSTLLAKAATGTLVGDGDRLLFVANPASPPGLTALLEPLVRGGSVVLVAHLDPDRLDSTYDAERATVRLV